MHEIIVRGPSRRSRNVGHGGSVPGKRPNYPWISRAPEILRALQIVGRKYGGLERAACLVPDEYMDSVIVDYAEIRGWSWESESDIEEMYSSFTNSVCQRMDKTNRYPAEKERLENLPPEIQQEAALIAKSFLARLKVAGLKPNVTTRYSSGRTSSETAKHNEPLRIELLSQKDRIALRKMMPKGKTSTVQKIVKPASD